MKVEKCLYRSSFLKYFLKSHRFFCCLFLDSFLSDCYNWENEGLGVFTMFLETERLILRKFREADFEDFCEFAMDEDMCRMMGRTP